MQATETPKVNHPARGLQHVPHHLLWLYQNGESRARKEDNTKVRLSLVQAFRGLLRLIQRQRSEDPEVGCIFHCHHSPHDYFVPCPNAPQANAESTPAKKRSKVRDPMSRSTIPANSCQKRAKDKDSVTPEGPSADRKGANTKVTPSKDRGSSPGGDTDIVMADAEGDTSSDSLRPFPVRNLAFVRTPRVDPSSRRSPRTRSRTWFDTFTLRI